MIDYILITGYARSGKDTFADALHDALCERYGDTPHVPYYLTTTLATPIKKVASFLTQGESFVDSTEGRNKQMSLGMTPRELWQWLGTDIMQHAIGKRFPKFKKAIGRTFWCRWLVNTIKGPLLVKDVRFQHEIDYFKSKGNCFIINVKRFSIPWYKRIFLHESERNIHKLPFNIQVDNAGTKDELEHTAKFIAGSAIFNRTEDKQ